MRARLTIFCLLTVSPDLRAAAVAADAALEKIIGEESVIERQTDPKDGPGWPDVSKPAEDRRIAALKGLQARLSSLPPSPEGSEEALTRQLLGYDLGDPEKGAGYGNCRKAADTDQVRPSSFHSLLPRRSPAVVTGSTLTVNADELRSRMRSTSLPSANSLPGASRVGAEMRVPLT